MGNQTIQEAAEFTGAPESNFVLWEAGVHAEFEQVKTVARAYRVDVLDALVEAGILTEEEAREGRIEMALTMLSDEQLISEITRRMGIAAGRDPDASCSASAALRKRLSDNEL